jgi:hypothetical protein
MPCHAVLSLQLVSGELIRIAILWHEQWHEALEEASRCGEGEGEGEGGTPTDIIIIHTLPARSLSESNKATQAPKRHQLIV